MNKVDKIVIGGNISELCYRIGIYHDINLYFVDNIYNHEYLEGFMKLLDISPEEFYEKIISENDLRGLNE